MAESEHLLKVWRGKRATYDALRNKDYWVRYSVKETDGTWTEYYGNNPLANYYDMCLKQDVLTSTSGYSESKNIVLTSDQGELQWKPYNRMIISTEAPTSSVGNNGDIYKRPVGQMEAHAYLSAIDTGYTVSGTPTNTTSPVDKDPSTNTTSYMQCTLVRTANGMSNIHYSFHTISLPEDAIILEQSAVVRAYITSATTTVIRSIKITADNNKRTSADALMHNSSIEHTVSLSGWEPKDYADGVKLSLYFQNTSTQTSNIRCRLYGARIDIKYILPNFAEYYIKENGVWVRKTFSEINTLFAGKNVLLV